MRVVFDMDFDPGCWPGPLQNRRAVVGEAWVGPRGFRNILENQLGLTGAYTSGAERALHLIQPMKAQTGFWSKSAESDPFGSAMRLLQWRDELWLWGWRGQSQSERLRQLARLTRDVERGNPDRLEAIISRLAKHPADIERVILFEPEDHLPWSWRQILLSLRKQGTAVEQVDLSPAKASGDLAGCRRKEFSPKKDGSLQLLRCYGAVESAEEAAAWLSSLPDGSSAVVIWPDPVLDYAIRRHGLPTLGAASDRHRNSMLSILPLILELAWDPQDPRVAFDLLSLPVSPVRKDVSRQLIDALHQWPAVGNNGWSDALDGALRAQNIFKPAVARGQRYPAKEIRKRVAALESWVNAYGKKNESLSEECNGVASQCAVMNHLLDACGMPDFSNLELGFLLEQSAPEESSAAWPAQAGFQVVENPGAVAGKVDYVLYWDFSLSRFSRPGGVPLSVNEWGEMQAAGVELVEPCEEALRQAQRWRRPFEMAEKAVLCVCPRRALDGEEEFPHPAWDEIRSRAKDDRGDLLEVERVIPARSLERARRETRSLVSPTASFTIPPDSIEPRKTESPSSLGKLLQCPLSYILHYTARVRPGRYSPPPEATDMLVLGNLSHFLLAEVLKQVRDGKQLTPQEGRKQLEKIFDQLAPRLAAGLFLPGNEDARASLRTRLGLVIGDVLELLRQGGFKVEGVEMQAEAPALGLQVSGRLDLLLGGPRAVVDFKWSGGTKRRRELQNGAAHQLAVYSHLVRDKRRKDFPPVAYFIVDSRRLITASPDCFPGAEETGGPGPRETWESLDRAFAQTWEALKRGRVDTGGVGEDVVATGRIEDGVLRLAPRCDYCDYQALCGLCFGGS